MNATTSFVRCVASSSRLTPSLTRSIRSAATFQRCYADVAAKVATSSATHETTLAEIEARGNVRLYRYAVDVHGQLFLHDTEPKNLTSCFKEQKFLNNFMSRIKQIKPAVETKNQESATTTPGRREEVELQRLWKTCVKEKYHWVSLCAGEYNLIRAADTPIVFRELSDDGMLLWAGNLQCPFEPSSLRVCAASGYLYHPSPVPERPAPSPRRPARTKPFGKYSLLSSALVQQQLASGLELEPDDFAKGHGGSVEWQGSRYDIGVLRQDDFDYERVGLGPQGSDLASWSDWFEDRNVFHSV